MGWLIAVFVVLVAVVGVVFGVTVTEERHLADECYSIGGIPVQGDATNGNPVVCLDPLVVLND